MSFPNLPGVPSLSGYNAPAAVATLAAPLINNLLEKLKPVWGIYDANGINKVLTPDTFISLDYRNEMNVSNFPIERGAFSSYNKVRTPYSLIVKVSKGSAVTSVGTGSSVNDRNSFLQTLEQLTASLDLYTIKTPEANYYNANLEEYDYRREVRNGVGMIIASLRFVEVIQASLLLSSSTNNAYEDPNGSGRLVAPDPTATTGVSAQAPVDNGMCQLNSPYTGTPYTFH